MAIAGFYDNNRAGMACTYQGDRNPSAAESNDLADEGNGGKQQVYDDRDGACDRAWDFVFVFWLVPEISV